jgi:acetoacetyl-CoA synthetase
MTQTRIREGDILWEPSAAARDASRLLAFLEHLRRTRDVRLPDYAAAWRWSTDNLEAFWGAVAEFFELPFQTPPSQILADASMPGARWFEGAAGNYVDAVLARRDDRRPALLATSEQRPVYAISWADLEAQIAAVAAGLRLMGVRKGDRVAAVMPNIPEAVVGFLATASIGAIWTSCAPEFGTQSVVDRLRQVAPTVLIAVDGYRYGGRDFDRRPVVEEIRGALPSLRTTILLQDLDPLASLEGEDWTTWADILETPVPSGRPAPEPVPFDHPLWILFSSGTTGLPKPIVHSHGGVVIEHAKELGLQLDVRPGDRLLWHTTTGWMMWNFVVGALLVGATPVLYDGNPAHPSMDTLWRIADEAHVTHLGMSAAFTMLCRKADLRPRDRFAMASLRCVGVTGSPLPVDGFEWFYRAVGGDVWLAPISGGTDMVTAFVGGCPILPVRAGEMQCCSLGARVEAFDAAGNPLPPGETGDLVITAPMPSMPIAFWNDPDGRRLRESYFEHFDGVWRHGDWIRFTASGGAVIEGRSDSTLNRNGVRFGTSEIYGVVDGFAEVADSLVIGLEEAGGGYWMPLFVALAPGVVMDAALEARIRSAIRTSLSPRHVPDEILVVPRIPRTLTGKKMEVPVKRLFIGHPLDAVAAAGAVADPEALPAFAALAAARRGRLA